MLRAPHLRFSGVEARAEAVVLLLHGGVENQFSPVRAFDPAVLRLIPFGRSVVRAGGGRITLASLRYAVRGWNGERESPLPDARWALDRIGERFGNVPVGLVGHSMGGRVALRVGDHKTVHSVAALAPWLPPGEQIPALDDRTVLLAHGTADRTTDPRATSQLGVKLREDGVEVEQHEFIGGRHAMLFPAGVWHDIVAEFMVRTLLTPELGSSSS
jgi:predicted esterase